TPTPHRVSPGSMPSTRTTRPPLPDVRVFDTLVRRGLALPRDTPRPWRAGGHHALPGSTDGLRAATGFRHVRRRAPARPATGGRAADRRPATRRRDLSGRARGRGLSLAPAAAAPPADPPRRAGRFPAAAA